MYRKNKELRYDYIKQTMEIKEIREMIISEYITDDLELSLKIIKYYNLNRIKDKYIDKFRDFNENYYSRKAIKREEKVFQIKVLMAREFQREAQEFMHYKRRMEYILYREMDFNDPENITFIKEYYIKNK